MHILCLVLFLGNKIFALWEFMIVLIFQWQLCLIFTVFLLNNLWNLWWGGKCFFIRFRNSFPMLVFTFLLYGGLNQMIFLFRCFLLLVKFQSISANFIALISSASFIDWWKSLISNTMNLYLLFTSIFMNHSITFCIFFHWLTFKCFIRLELILSIVTLLILPISFLAVLINLTVRLFWKFSIWSLRVQKQSLSSSFFFIFFFILFLIFVFVFLYFEVIAFCDNLSCSSFVSW